MAIDVSDFLVRELATYEQHRDELIGVHPECFVLIHEDQIIGAYESERDAINEGYRRCGEVPFLVKQLLPNDQPLNFMSGLALR